MRQGWDELPLGQAPLQIIDGDRGKAYPKHGDFSDDGYCLFLSAANVTSSGFDFSECQFISEQKDEELRKGRLSRQDVVLTTRGTLGNAALYGDDVPYDHVRINSGMVIMRTDPAKLLPAFLFGFLRSPGFNRQVEQLRSGVAQPQLPIRDINKIKLPLPRKEVQERIVAVFAAYDDLIENNRRRMALLEEAARQLYREWFVRLHFPGHEHTRITNGVPDGWVRKRFGKLLDHYIGGGWGQDEPKGSETEEGYVIRGTDIPEVEAGNFGAVGLRYHDPRCLPQRVLQAGDIIFEVSGGSATQAIGRTLLITEEVLRALAPRVICASFCKLFRLFDPVLPFFLVRFLRHIRESGELSVFQKQSASALQNFQYQSFLEEQGVLLPTTGLLKEFCTTQATLLRQQQTLAIQNHKLRAARDLLLPRLMSGEMAV